MTQTFYKPKISSNILASKQDAALETIRLTMKSLITQLVDVEDAVQVDLKRGEQTHAFIVQVDKSDLGKIIGKQGKNITSLRTLLWSLGFKQKLKIVIELVEQ